jgi:hypothetical protein
MPTVRSSMAPGSDELQVVHDQEGEVGTLCLEPPGAGLQIAEHQASGVAEVEAGASDEPDGGVESSSSAGISREKTPTGCAARRRRGE